MFFQTLPTVPIIHTQSSSAKLARGDLVRNVAYLCMLYLSLTDDNLLLVVVERVLGDLEVKGGGALADTSRDVVVGSVAGAEPTTVVTSLTDGDASKVSADTKHDEPLGALGALLVGLGVTERLDVNVVGLSNLVGRAVTDEDGLSTPLDDEVLACIR